MKEDYILGFTLFGAKYNGYRTSYRHFSNVEQLKNYIKYHPNIKNNYMIYKSIKIEEL